MSAGEEGDSDDINEMGDGRGHAFVIDEAEESNMEGVDGDNESDEWTDYDSSDDEEDDDERDVKFHKDLVDMSKMTNEEIWEHKVRKIMDYAKNNDVRDDLDLDDDESDDMPDFDFGAYDSSDSWDIKVSESPRTGAIEAGLDVKILSKRLQFFAAREHIPGTPTFHQFGQLPAELRLRIWETYCSELRRKHRVIQVFVHQRGRLTPAVTMDQQTEPVRRMMSICRETREMGLKALPDVLHVGHSRHDKAVIRFNAETDLIHFFDEHPFGLDVRNAATTGEDIDSDLTERQRKILREHVQLVTPEPYHSVRNLAIGDNLVRSREPGAYQTHYLEQSVIELLSPDHASHREPHELRDETFLRSIEYLFPNLQNIYVVEDGAFRHSDRWAGHIRSHQRYHVDCFEMNEYETAKVKIEYLYLWHAPPKNAGRVSRGAIADRRVASNKDEENGDNKDMEDRDKGDTENGNSDDTKSSTPKASEIPGDFKDEVVIGHFARLREKGVRFSRLLFFEDEGMDDYWQLQFGCRPDGHWPNDEYGVPQQDQLPSRYADEEFGWHGGVSDNSDEEEEEEEDSMIDDDDIFEDESEEDSDEFAGLHDDDSGDENDGPPLPLEAMFSSPEPEPGTEANTRDAAGAQDRRGKKRHVIVDSDDDDDDDEDDDGDDNGDSARPAQKSKTGAGSSKRQRRPLIVSSDDDEEAKGATKRDGSSSHREAGEGGEDSGNDDEELDADSDDKPAKPLTLMQKLALGRKSIPVMTVDDGEEDDEDAEEYAGDYGERNGEDEEEES
ncbi:uncharacterized protein SPSK_08644 [Sporothrix schenckii 1099-18]|uniref:2EXR domain-containing protein n=1 Tax=Sporothrix schenckii 1099-18 TaxID=1397361 RepID=A0A0F2M5W4_SPOSC|nr:uncharacterized protein SPSK_08644 [Sporothrix schenckii 1099-18]KJR84195.1 hypothetical protein SPSK_08644 [Sporothrix schenckii 1099-18]